MCLVNYPYLVHSMLLIVYMIFLFTLSLTFRFLRHLSLFHISYWCNNILINVKVFNYDVTYVNNVGNLINNQGKYRVEINLYSKINLKSFKKQSLFTIVQPGVDCAATSADDSVSRLTLAFQIFISFMLFAAFLKILVFSSTECLWKITYQMGKTNIHSSG